jgi:trigger factor
VTLTIHTEEDEQRQLLMTVEVPEDRVEEMMRTVAQKLARDVRIPGFRKGKAPYNVMLKRVGADYLRTEAIEELVQPSFEEALREIDVVPYAQASLENIETDPLTIKYMIPLEPKVTLNEAYREQRKDVEPVEITDEAVAEALEQVRVRHQVIEPVERPVAQGDVVSLAGKGVLLPAAKETDEKDAEAAEETEVNADSAEEVLFDEEQTEILMDPEIIFPGTAFVENIVGLSVGDEKAFTFSFPEDYEEAELSGRTASFGINVLEVKSRILPELDDDLARQEGSYETLEELRESLAENLRTQAESKVKGELIDGLIADLVENSVIIYAPAALDLEIDDMLEELKAQIQRSGWLWDDYLKIQGLTEVTIRDNFAESAKERIQNRLVLRQFVFDEKLTVEAGDIDAKIEERLAAFSENEELRESMRQYFQTGYGLDMMSSEILMDKVAERAAEIYSGSAPSLAELAAAAEAAQAADEEE